MKDPWKCPTERGDFHQENMGIYWELSLIYDIYDIYISFLLGFYTCLYMCLPTKMSFFSRGLYVSINVCFFLGGGVINVYK